MSRIPLAASASATVAADGTARCTLSPQTFGVSWEVTRTVVNSNSILATQFQMFLNNENANSLIDASYSGNQDTSDTVYTLRDTDVLHCLWKGGTVGAACTVILGGTLDTGR